MKKYQTALMAGGSVLVLAFGHTSVATAQTSTPEAASKVETVIVTARKRSEDILKVPVAVSALTGTQLAARGVETVQDLTNFVPGLTDDQAINGTLRNDRSFQSLVIRGLMQSSLANPTTSVFINGTPVASADFVQDFSDLNSVEVLKGPQSAYFGRQTFAGAVNFIAKPAGNAFTYDLSGEVGTRHTDVFSGNVTVPVIDDKLSFRVGGNYSAHDGSYKNPLNTSQTLGDQSSKSAHIAITAHPIENLTIKAYGLIFQDNDGAPATGLLIADPTSPYNQSNCTVSGVAYFCGTLPGLIRSVSPAQSMGVNPAFLQNRGGILGSDDLVHGFGLKRNAYHGDLDIDYAIPSLGLTVSYLGAYDQDHWDEIADIASLGTQYGPYPGFAFEVQNKAHDYSHELRVASDASKSFRYLVGISYVDALSQGATGTTQFGLKVSNGAPAGSKTTGAFFALAYDVLPQVTVNFDGRFEQDKETVYSAAGPTLASGTSKDFLPRVSIQFKPEKDQMIYATYSKGVNPGKFNTQYPSLPTASQADLTSLGVAGGLVVHPEYISNYEIGYKGSFFDERATLSVDVYLDKWTSQLTARGFTFAGNDPANPYNVVGSNFFIPGNVSPFIYNYTDNSSSTTAKGLEFETTFIPIEHVTVSFTGAINDTRYDTYICTLCQPYPQIPGINVAGKQMLGSPKDSFALGVEYANHTDLFGGARYYIRGDYIYKDGVYIQSDNITKTPNLDLVNIKGGLEFGNTTLEAYVNNVFNSRDYLGGFEATNFHTFGTNAVEVALPELITGGIKLKYKY